MSIGGRWSTDNSGANIFVNGVGTGQSAGGFTSWFNFGVNSGFVAGINTLDFLVRDAGVIAGFRVEMTGSGDLAASVPEPRSIALALLGFALLVGARRTRSPLKVSSKKGF